MVNTGTYIDLVATHGGREHLPIPQRESVGADLGVREEEEVKAFAELARHVGEQRKAIEGYVDHAIRELAPNVTELVGPMIAARLVTLAGSVEELARAPSGTVQLLGAERALFRHLRTGSRPPKHGVLFQHPLVHRAPRWQRGAIARVIAARVAMAARADAYTKRRIAPDLARSLNAAVEEIRRRKAERPARPKRDESRSKRRSRKGPRR